MKRYEDIGNFWNERRAGNMQADVEKREAEQTLKAARRRGRAGSIVGEKKQDLKAEKEESGDETNHFFSDRRESRTHPSDELRIYTE